MPPPAEDWGSPGMILMTPHDNEERIRVLEYLTELQRRINDLKGTPFKEENISCLVDCIEMMACAIEKGEHWKDR